MRFFRIPSFTGIETHRDDADRGSLRAVEGCLPHGPGGVRSGPVWEEVANVTQFSNNSHNELTGFDDPYGNSILVASRAGEIHDIQVISKENTPVGSFDTEYPVLESLVHDQRPAPITPVGNRMYSLGDGSAEAVFFGQGPAGENHYVYPDGELYSLEHSRFPSCRFFVQGPNKALFGAGNPDKPLTVYVSEPAGLSQPVRDNPYSTELTADFEGRLSTVDILGSNASQITALSTRGNQVVVHTDKGCHLLYAPTGDQASTGYRVEQASATNFSAAVNVQVVAGESGSQNFWLGHDGQIYKDEAAARGAEDKKNFTDGSQASWKSKGVWEKELPDDLSKSFATYDPQSGMYWVFTETPDFYDFMSGEPPETPLGLKISSISPETPDTPTFLRVSGSSPDLPGTPLNLSLGVVPDAPLAPQNLTLTFLPDAPDSPDNLTITEAVPDAPNPVTGLSIPTPVSGPGFLTASNAEPSAGPSNLSGEVVLPSNGPSNLTGARRAPIVGPSELKFAFDIPQQGPSNLTGELQPPLNGPFNLSHVPNAPAYGPSSLNAHGPVSGPNNLTGELASPAGGPSNLLVQGPAQGPSLLTSSIDAPVAGPLNLTGERVPDAGGSTTTIIHTPDATKIVMTGYASSERLDLGEMIWVDPGTYTVGSPTDEPGRNSTETERQVTLAGFYLAKYQTTNKVWQEVMDIYNTASFSNRNSYDHGALDKVNWEQAQQFITALNTKEEAAGRLPYGWKYELPTGDEWEVASRAGCAGMYATPCGIAEEREDWGGFPLGGWNTTVDLPGFVFRTANLSGNSVDSSVSPNPKLAGRGADVVGLQKEHFRWSPDDAVPNDWGFYDMHGNVWEWTADAATGSNYYARGGGWYSTWNDIRSASSKAINKASTDDDIGFRVVLKPQGNPAIVIPQAGPINLTATAQAPLLIPSIQATDTWNQSETSTTVTVTVAPNIGQQTGAYNEVSISYQPYFKDWNNDGNLNFLDFAGGASNNAGVTPPTKMTKSEGYNASGHTFEIDIPYIDGNPSRLAVTASFIDRNTVTNGITDSITTSIEVINYEVPAGAGGAPSSGPTNLTAVFDGAITIPGRPAPSVGPTNLAGALQGVLEPYQVDGAIIGYEDRVNPGFAYDRDSQAHTDQRDVYPALDAEGMSAGDCGSTQYNDCMTSYYPESVNGKSVHWWTAEFVPSNSRVAVFAGLTFEGFRNKADLEDAPYGDFAQRWKSTLQGTQPSWKHTRINSGGEIVETWLVFNPASTQYELFRGKRQGTGSNHYWRSPVPYYKVNNYAGATDPDNPFGFYRNQTNQWHAFIGTGARDGTQTQTGWFQLGLDIPSEFLNGGSGLQIDVTGVVRETY